MFSCGYILGVPYIISSTSVLCEMSATRSEKKNKNKNKKTNQTTNQNNLISDFLS